VKLFAELDGVLLDPVYTGKAAAGLIDGVKNNRFLKIVGLSCLSIQEERPLCLHMQISKGEFYEH
jgi:1-aminocyclopropane-1-carboxylate deaminase/D-cysteine desulfhydrase-like pyridoxal-dependent ACC family enzyme